MFDPTLSDDPDRRSSFGGPLGGGIDLGNEISDNEYGGSWNLYCYDTAKKMVWILQLPLNDRP